MLFKFTISKNAKKVFSFMIQQTFIFKLKPGDTSVQTSVEPLQNACKFSPRQQW